ncbi:hypothetical protein N7466_002469 [Penicillium verhagenii]|uniref:uncharacterized protein n=1 Tax=Penicillium verhagenii TaxID=1562060 RepID=UPI0025459EB7|nr:uncharacterized protein N7466_002469 [Penicillium verhagenii]KAJ5939335.1 hypothetical protein N7466_002469 [Penicillium verhagenii]
MDTTVKTPTAKQGRKRGGPACEDCKARKKRCIHRGAELETEVLPGPSSPAPTLGDPMKTRRRKREDDHKSPATKPSGAAPTSDTDASSAAAANKLHHTKRSRSLKAPQTPAITAAKPKPRTKIKRKRKVIVEAADEEIDASNNQSIKRDLCKPAKSSFTDRSALSAASSGNSIETADDDDPNGSSTPLSPLTPVPGSVPAQPVDALQGSAQMSIHLVLSRDLERRLDRLKADFKTARDTMDTATESAGAVIAAVDAWKETWAKGGH